MPALKRPPLLIVLLALICVVAGIFVWWKYFYLDPNSYKTYYLIFDKHAILDGTETRAVEVDQKLDQRLKKYHKVFAKMAGTEDEYKLRALFYMNFVHYYGYYGQRTLKEKSLKEILWGGENFHCGTNTTLLAMLLEKAGYEYRTVSINNNSHGLVSVKFDGQWNALGPTTNTWFSKSVAEMAAGEPRTVKQFLTQADDVNNTKARAHLTDPAILCDYVCLKNQMLSIGEGFNVKVDKYDYIDLSEYTY